MKIGVSAQLVVLFGGVDGEADLGQVLDRHTLEVDLVALVEDLAGGAEEAALQGVGGCGGVAG